MKADVRPFVKLSPGEIALFKGPRKRSPEEMSFISVLCREAIARSKDRAGQKSKLAISDCLVYDHAKEKLERGQIRKKRTIAAKREGKCFT